MPSHKVHAYIDRLFFGKAYWKVHHRIDSAYPYLGGKHRIFWHDPVSAYAIAADAYPGDANAQAAAFLHIEVDNQCSADPTFRAWLEWWADREAKKRKREPKSKTKAKPRRKKAGPPEEVQELTQFMKKLVEIRRLAQLIHG